MAEQGPTRIPKAAAGATLRPAEEEDLERATAYWMKIVTVIHILPTQHR